MRFHRIESHNTRSAKPQRRNVSPFGYGQLTVGIKYVGLYSAVAQHRLLIAPEKSKLTLIAFLSVECH